MRRRTTMMVSAFAIGFAAPFGVAKLISPRTSPTWRDANPSSDRDDAACVPPTSWDAIPPRVFPVTTADGQRIVVTFHPAHPATTVFTVMDIIPGDRHQMITYNPWVHDHRCTPPMPKAYVDSLLAVLTALGPSADIIGLEGDAYPEDVRATHDLMRAITTHPFPAACTEAMDATTCDLTADWSQLAEMATIAAHHANDMPTSSMLRSFTATPGPPIIGVEDERFLDTPGLLPCHDSLLAELHDAFPSIEVPDGTDACVELSGWSRAQDIARYLQQAFRRQRAWCAYERVDRMSRFDEERERGHAAVRNLLDALASRRVSHGILLFGQWHIDDIIDAARAGGATLQLVCTPHLCDTTTALAQAGE